MQRREDSLSLSLEASAAVFAAAILHPSYSLSLLLKLRRIASESCRLGGAETAKGLVQRTEEYFLPNCVCLCRVGVACVWVHDVYVFFYVCVSLCALSTACCSMIIVIILFFPSTEKRSHFVMEVIENRGSAAVTKSIFDYLTLPCDCS